MKTGKFNYSHIITVACFSIQAIGVGTYISFGVFFNSLIDEFGWPRATIAGASSLAFFLMGFFGIFVGRLNDRLGPRKMMIITSIFFGVGHMLMSRAETVWSLYLFYGVIVGIGMSSIDIIALSTIARWFAKKRGLMTGIVKVGTGAGQFMLPLAASFLIAGVGWRTAYLVIGLSVLLILTFIAYWLKRDPAEHGWPLDWEKGPPNRRTADIGAGLTRKEAFATKQFWSLSLTNLMIILCLMTVMVHIVPHAQDIGISAAKAAGILSTIGGVSMLGRFLTGIYVDRFGSRVAMILSLVLLVASLVWLHFAKVIWTLYLFATIYGLAHGGIFTAISPIVAELFGIRMHGTLFGLVMFFGTVGGALGPIVAGSIFDHSGGYMWAFWLCVLISTLGLVQIVLLQPIKTAGLEEAEGSPP